MKKFSHIILLFLLIFCLMGCNDVPDTPDTPTIPNTPCVPEEPNEMIAHTKLLLLDQENNYIELLNCEATTISKNTKISRYVNEKLVDAGLDDLMIGMDNLYVKSKGKEILHLIIDNECAFNRIRVGIRKSINNIADINTLYHDTITILINSDTTLRTYDNSKVFSIKQGTSLTFSNQNKKIVCYIGKILYSFDKRIIIDEAQNEMTVSSISRGVGIPSYSGNLEISIHDNKLLLTNDVLMEDYLTKVVPSEMPSSWNIEALKAQAVAARTYAYREIYNRKFMSYGYVVDDSESSQVYNNQKAQSSSTRAVNETKGITMFYDNEPIIAYYYSCSSGLTGNGNEVWIQDKVIEDIPYLHGKNLTDKEVDVSDENSVLDFYKTIKMSAPSASSSNFRWLIQMNRDQLQETLNINLPLMVKGNESSYPILKDGKWQVSEFPSDIGKIKDIFVSERGASGVVVSLEIVAENVTFRIYNQYNIRFTIRPKDVSSTVYKYNSNGYNDTYQSTSKNPSILTSGYFALEWNGDVLSFYGGGSGHGVGMCQYSANYYGNNGYTFKRILSVFYDNVEMIDTSKTYTVIKDFGKLFQ